VPKRKGNLKRICVTINAKLEKELREYAKKVHGERHGALSKAVEDAIFLWLVYQRALEEMVKENADTEEKK